MRTKGFLVSLGLLTSFAAANGCGDDETTSGGGGQGGSTTTTTATTTTTSTSTSTSSSTGSGLGGGDPEACPGQAITLGPGQTTSVSDSTADRQNDFDVFCAAGSTAPDAVYALEITGPCSLSAAVTGSNGLDPALSVRFQQCDSRLGGDFCFPEGAWAQHVDAGTVWLIVDGQSDTAGDYALDIDCAVPECGDGILNPGEECDYGPDDPNDSCNAMCQVEDPGVPDCMAITSTLDIPVGLTVLPPMDPWYDTSDGLDDYKGTCMPGGENGGQDEVFRFVPQVSGTLEIETALDLMGNPVCIPPVYNQPECWFSFLYVRGADCEAGAELACGGIDPDPMSPTGGINRISLPVTGGETYHLFVDGLNGEVYSQGPYTLHFTLTP